MHFINLSGVPNSGKSTTGKERAKLLPDSCFIEVDDLGTGKEEKYANLVKLLKKHKQDKKYKNVIFSCLMTDDLYKQCGFLNKGSDNFINISLVPRLEKLLSNRDGKREPTPEIKKLITKMYTEWGFDKPKHSDLIIDNSDIDLQTTAKQIFDFIQTTQVNSFHNGEKKVKMKFLDKIRQIFHKEKDQ